MHPTEKECKAMRDGIGRGDVAAVRHLINARIYVRKTIIDPIARRTALHVAAADRQLEICRLLINRGADVSARDANNRTVLHLATGNVDARAKEICKVLIAAGAEVDAKDNEGVTPLFYVSIVGDLEICRMLIAQHGADVRVSGKNGSTPLHWAARNAHVDVCRLLIEFGADASAADNKGATPLHETAYSRGRKAAMDVIKMLLKEGADPAFTPVDPPKGYLTPFQNAVAMGRSQSVSHFVLDCGEDPAQIALNGRSMIEVSGLHESVMRPLLLSLTTERSIRQSMDGGSKTPVLPAPKRSSGMSPL